MQVTNEMIERAAKAVEKMVKQSTYGWSDEQFEIYWTKDPRFIEQQHFWGDAFGRGTEKIAFNGRSASRLKPPFPMERIPRWRRCWTR